MQRIIIDPDICGGQPTIRGTRIAARTVLGFLSAGDSIEDILTEERISKLTVSGTVADCITKLEALSEVGIDHVTLVFKGDDLDKQIDTFSREILPRFI